MVPVPCCFQNSRNMQLVAHFRDSKRLIEVADSRADEKCLRDAIALSFPEIPDVNACLIQVYDQDFESFLDYTPSTVLKHKGRVLIIDKEKERASCMSVVEQAANDDGGSEAREQHVILSPDTLSRTPLRENVQVADYRLPNFPPDLELSLRACKDKLTIDSSLRSRIVSWMYHDLRRYDIYPRKLYTEAARQLVLRNGMLRDSLGSGYDSWQRSLRWKAKYERSKMASVGEIQAVRQKFAPKRAAAVASASAERVSRDIRECVATEDSHSVESHRAWMCKELQKTVPDPVKIEDGMCRTFEARRLWTQKEKPSSTLILQQYPALCIGRHVFAEFSRITGVQLESAYRDVVGTHFQTLLRLVDGKDKPDALIQVLSNCCALSKDEKSEAEQLAFLLMLPLMLKESYRAFLATTETCPVYPTAVCSEIRADNCTRVAIEDFEVEGATPVQAILLAFALTWVLDFQYNSKCRRTFMTIEHLVGLSYSKLGVMCTRLMSVLKKGSAQQQ